MPSGDEYRRKQKHDARIDTNREHKSSRGRKRHLKMTDIIDAVTLPNVVFSAYVHPCWYKFINSEFASSIQLVLHGHIFIVTI